MSTYNGQVHTCVNGGYQQEYMFEILGEAVDRYPLDGVFFNMIGYQRSDYWAPTRRLPVRELPPAASASSPASTCPRTCAREARLASHTRSSSA